MKRLLLGAALGALAMSVGLASGEEGTKYGNGVTLTQAVTVADLLARPEQYLGKTVRVDGVVGSVCQNMGCWIQLADGEAGPGIQFKVDDGVIVFPKDGKGRRASAEGVFDAMPDEPEHAGHTTDATHEHPAATEAPKYRVKATGAVIY